MGITKKKESAPKTLSGQFRESDNNDERLSEIIEYAERFIRAAKALQEGRPITESYDEIFLEDKRELRGATSSFSRIIEHLYKLALCDSEVDLERNWAGWNISIDHQRDSLVETLEWVYGKQTTLANTIRGNMASLYYAGKALYERAMRGLPSLIKGHRRIPNTVLWSMEELLDSPIKELIIKLMEHIEPGGINPDDWNRVLIEKLGL